MKWPLLKEVVLGTEIVNQAQADISTKAYLIHAQALHGYGTTTKLMSNKMLHVYSPLLPEKNLYDLPTMQPF